MAGISNHNLMNLGYDLVVADSRDLQCVDCAVSKFIAKTGSHEHLCIWVGCNINPRFFVSDPNKVGIEKLVDLVEIEISHR